MPRCPRGKLVQFGGRGQGTGQITTRRRLFDVCGLLKEGEKNLLARVLGWQLATIRISKSYLSCSSVWHEFGNYPTLMLRCLWAACSIWQDLGVYKNSSCFMVQCDLDGSNRVFLKAEGWNYSCWACTLQTTVVYGLGVKSPFPYVKADDPSFVMLRIWNELQLFR